METECYCYDDKGDYYKPDNDSSVFATCNRQSNNKKNVETGMFHIRDCKHRLTCCPLSAYDYPESTKLKTSKLNLQYGAIEEERYFNIMWISMEPYEFSKSLSDYPEIFNTKIDYNEDSIKSGQDNNINSVLVLPKDEKYAEIPITGECESKKCNILNQVCSSGKICLNKPNLQNLCQRPPCWHTIPSKTDNCQIGKCTDIGQLCTRDGGRICSIYPNIDEGCEEGPCWNKVPILNECVGKQCSYEGQQCSGGTHNLNFPGFVCLNKRNDSYGSEPCSNPPCWHKIENETTDCSSQKCSYVGQKCRIGGTDKYPDQKVCLDKTNIGCSEPPCWFNIPGVTECNKDGMICEDMDSDTVEPIDTMIYSSTESILVKKTNNIVFIFADILFLNKKDLIQRLITNSERMNPNNIIIIEWMPNKNWSHLNTFDNNEIKKNNILITNQDELFSSNDIIEIVGIVKFKNAKTKITYQIKNKFNTMNTYYLTNTSTEYDNKKLKFIGFSENNTNMIFSMNTEGEWSNLSNTGIKISTGKLISKLIRQNCEREKCSQVEAKDDKGNIIKDDFGNPVLIPNECTYQGSCVNPGQKCRSDSSYNEDTKEWIGGIQKECVNSYRQVDTLPSSIFNPESCLQKPCWMDITNPLDPYFWGEPINNHSENSEGNFVKSDNKINTFNTIINSQKVTEVYKFKPEDKEGYITKNKLLKFMTQNWMIFEANVLNIDTLWTKYSNNNRLNYGPFSAMMRVLNVETFKFRNNQRIVPRIIPENQLNEYVSRFGINLASPFKETLCNEEEDCPGGRCGCNCLFGCVDNCCKDINGNVDPNNCPSKKCFKY